MTALLGLTPLLGCSQGGSAAAQNPQDRSALASLSQQHDAVKRKYLGLSEGQRDKCELEVGECLLEVKDARRELTRSTTFPQCSTRPTPFEREQCEEQAVADGGRAKDVGRFYELEQWCLDGILKCVEQLQSKDASQAKSALVEARRAKIETTPAGRALQLSLAVAQERINFLRSTLPPEADTLCKDTSAYDDCQARVEEQSKAFEAALAQDEGVYKEAEAQRLYGIVRQTDVSCFDYERDCLFGKLEEFGATAESRPLLDRNLELLEQRQVALADTRPNVADACKRLAVEKHQMEIIENYRQYANRPIAYFWHQLQRAFIRLHEAELRCLRSNARSPGAAQASPAAAPSTAR